jgi:hypothetical protein
MTDTQTPAADVAGPQAAQSPKVAHLPLGSRVNCPAIPFWYVDYLKHIAATLLRLVVRAGQIQVAKRGLSKKYTLAGQRHSAYWFLYGSTPSLSDAIAALASKLAGWPSVTGPLAVGGSDPVADAAKDSLEAPDLPLEDPRQFTMPWTMFEDIYESSEDLIESFSATLTNIDKANESFWPTIANFGLPYNLLILKQVDADRCRSLAEEFGNVWADEDAGAGQPTPHRYEIDMSFMGPLKRVLGDSQVRFTPGTHTLLEQDPESKALMPVAINVFTEHGKQTFTPSDSAWLYALQAAKTSITVYGTWLGHVYQWHIVTAAMQMTMYNNLSDTHCLWPLMNPQSEFLIDFDYFLLLDGIWDLLAPPTPIGSPNDLLDLFERFAAPSPRAPQGRQFFDDDPPTALKQLGLDEKDFTKQEAWDAYPLVGFLLDIWNLTHEYVKSVVYQVYADDAAVKNDGALQQWLGASRDPTQGNIKGLPEVDNRDGLIAVLTSLLHRVTAHGVGRVNPTVNPVLSFVANFPPCLQDDNVPNPGDKVSLERLLGLLPHTGTLGGMTNFYYVFIFSVPYVPLIPLDGVRADPQFSDPVCNEALFKYRENMVSLIDRYVATWNRELAAMRGDKADLPVYAKHLHHQWPRSIET